ncbi:MAG: hypothetical protein RIR00_324 [Pseudomonadota bacterium]|jgi:hypothetical protein
MTSPIDLAVRRGALQAQIAMQRQQLGPLLRPVENGLAVADQAVKGAQWLRAHSLQVGAAALVLALLRPRRAWRWGRRSFALWRGWQALKQRLDALTA